MDSSEFSSDTFDISQGQWRREGQDSSDHQDGDSSIPEKPQSMKTPNQGLNLKIPPDIVWADWIRLPHGVWHRKGQDSQGDLFQENTDKDPRSPASSTGSGQSYDCDYLPDINWGPWSRLPHGQWHREGQDSSGIRYEDSRDEDPREPPSAEESSQSFDCDALNTGGPTAASPSRWGPLFQEGQRDDEDAKRHALATSGAFGHVGSPLRNSMLINWGPWRCLPSGGWHREGQDMSGNWYEDDQDADPRQPHSQASLDFGGYEQATMERQEDEGKQTAIPEHFESSPRADYGRKHLRSYQGDLKGHSGHVKSSKSSRTNVKGKGREQIQLGNLTTADDGVEDAVVDDRIPAFPQNLQSIADMYQSGKVGESSSSSTAATYPGYYAPADVEEQIDALPTLQRGPLRSRTRWGDQSYNEDWSQYVVQPSRKFQFGTVFKIMWSEPMGVSRLSKHNKDPVNTGTSISEFGARNIDGTTLYEGIRRFIVIDGAENGAKNGNSICVPIATYKKQGCTKPGVKPHHHGVIHTHDKMPLLLNNEPDLGVSPIRLVVDRQLEGIERLAPESRINYSRHVTIEHNASIHIIGHIHLDDLDVLAAGVNDTWEKRVRQRKKDKVNERTWGKGGSRKENPKSVGTSSNLSERQGPYGMRQEGHRPENSPTEHLGSTHRPIPSSPDNDREKGAKQGNHPPLSPMVRGKPTTIHEEAQEPHVSEDTHVSASDTQELKEEPDSRLESLPDSNHLIHDESSNVEGAKVHSTRSVSLPNSPQSPVSSICLTETPSDTSARGPRLTRSQKRLILVSSLISYVTFLLETQTRSRGEDSQSENSQSTQSGSITGQSIPPNRKRKLSHHARNKGIDEKESSEEESDEEEESLDRAGKGKEKQPQPLFACPYVKHDGPKAICDNRGRRTVARVKEHLYKHHRQAIHCPRCCITFEDQNALDTHLRQPVQLQCASSDEEKPEGFDKMQEKELKSRKGLCKMTECEKWRNIYRILFPDEHNQIPSPYFDPDDSHKLLGALNANQRQELKGAFCRAAKKLKVKYREDCGSELNPEFINELVDVALDECLDDDMSKDVDEDVVKTVNEVCGTSSANVNEEHYDGEGCGVAAQDSSVQFSYQEDTSAMGPPWESARDDCTNESFWPFWPPEEDFLLDFVVEESILNSGPSDPGMGSMTGAPNYPHDVGVHEHTLDSGYSSKKSQGAQVRISEDREIGCSR